MSSPYIGYVTWPSKQGTIGKLIRIPMVPLLSTKHLSKERLVSTPSCVTFGKGHLCLSWTCEKVSWFCRSPGKIAWGDPVPKITTSTLMQVKGAAINPSLMTLKCGHYSSGIASESDL